jgi:hypothetical protein
MDGGGDEKTFSPLEFCSLHIFLFTDWMHCCRHKVITYIEYRAVSGVFRTIEPSSPLHPASMSSPAGTHSPGGEGMGVNIWEDARHGIGLLQYNPSTGIQYLSLATIRRHQELAQNSKPIKDERFKRTSNLKIEQPTVQLAGGRGWNQLKLNKKNWPCTQNSYP